MEYTPIIGLEIHVELKTASKMFCACSAEHFGIKPNTHTCPVCLGLPGALPVPNKKAIQWCQLIGLALNCKLSKESKFDRKHYFYPDLPKGFQISQYDAPFASNGELKLKAQSAKSKTADKKSKTIKITRVHMEEDTGKLVHRKINGVEATLVDFNRSGVPLVEIVTEPDFNSADEVDKFLKMLQQIIRYLGVSDCDMEKGSMRLEVNLSLTSKQTLLPSYKVEIKNINSFKFVGKAICYEIKRQTGLLLKGETPKQETRGFDETHGKTVSQRSKEEAQDYRYFPEPDIPPVLICDDEIEIVRRQLTELPEDKRRRFIESYQLRQEQAQVLVRTRQTADFFEESVKVGKKHRITANKIANVMINKKVDAGKIEPAKLIKMLVKRASCRISDEKELEKLAKEAIDCNLQAVEDFKNGKAQAIGVLIGSVMKKTKGKADAGKIRDILTKLLVSA